MISCSLGNLLRDPQRLTKEYVEFMIDVSQERMKKISLGDLDKEVISYAIRTMKNFINLTRKKGE